MILEDVVDTNKIVQATVWMASTLCIVFDIL